MASADLEQAIVVIPAYNEEAGLARVLEVLPAVGRVIVVDHGSTDATAQVASSAGATVVSERHGGYGTACKRGLRTIEALIADGEPPPDVVVFLEADFADHPDLLSRIVRPVLTDQADLVVSSRLKGKRDARSMPWHSVLASRLASIWIRLRWRVRFTDIGRFRAINYEVLKRLKLDSGGFGFPVELQIRAVQAGLRILELPVPYRRRVGRSKVSGTFFGSLRAAVHLLWTLVRLSLGG